MMTPCQCNNFFFHPLPRTVEQSGRVNIQAGKSRKSICKLFNFHRLFISQLATRYYGALNYYARQGHISRACISRFSGLTIHHSFANGWDLGRTQNVNDFRMQRRSYFFSEITDETKLLLQKKSNFLYQFF